MRSKYRSNIESSGPVQPDELVTFLFVPADRPERFEKAAKSGADAIIIDLEDAVAAPAKAEARDAVEAAFSYLDTGVATYLRVNGTSTPWHDEDIALASRLPLSGIVLPKAEGAAELSALRGRLPPDRTLIAIIETAKGLASADEIANAADRLAFGSVDLSSDLRCAHEREALLFARSRIVLSARLANRPAPIDGVTLAIKDEDAIEDDARHASKLGFGGKLLIHPAQIEPAKRGLAPSDAEFAWASDVVTNAPDGSARSIDGAMVDAPVLERAWQIVRARERLLGPRTDP